MFLLLSWPYFQLLLEVIFFMCGYVIGQCFHMAEYGSCHTLAQSDVP